MLAVTFNRSNTAVPRLGRCHHIECSGSEPQCITNALVAQGTM